MEEWKYGRMEVLVLKFVIEVLPYFQSSSLPHLYSAWSIRKLTLPSSV